MSATAQIDDCYLAAGRHYDDDRDQYKVRARNWRIATFGLIPALLMSIGFSWWLAAQQQVEIVTVLVDGNGRTLETTSHTTMSPDQLARVRENIMRDYISSARSVSSDGWGQRALIERVYAHTASGSPAESFLHAFYAAKPPFEVEEVRAVQIHAVLVISERTYEVEWTETTRDLKGGVKGAERWRASLTWRIQPPDNVDAAQKNALGIYITELNWTSVRQ